MELRSQQRRFLLRSATTAAHQSLEGELGEIGSRASYVRYISAMTRFRGAIERLLPAADDSDHFHPTVIHEYLVRDCEDLELSDLAPLTTAIETRGDANLGVAYVLEGSAMGASLLIRSAEALGFSAKFGARHLSRQIERRPNWSAFIAYLEQPLSLDMTKVIAAANATFALARAAAKVGAHAA